jgi:hypothetical protein
MASERSLSMTIRYWYDDGTGEIKLVGRDDSPLPLWTSVNLNTDSRRNHPNLYNKLYNRLKRAGKVPD